MLAVRHLRPTDLVALASFEGKAFPNEVRTRDQLYREHRRPLSIAAVLEQWIAAEDRQTFVAVGPSGIHGLISVRQRAGKSAWEVEWLALDQELQPEETSVALLERVGEAAVEAGVQRIFLRVGKQSPLGAGAHRAGFVPCMTETLCRRPAAATAERAPRIEGLRRRQKADDLGIFRLYHRAVPAQVRSLEGMTIEEWLASQDGQFDRQKEFVWWHDDQIRAWLQVNRGHGSGQFRLLSNPDDGDRLFLLVHFALGCLRRQDPVLALVPHFQSALFAVLVSEWGFDEVTEYQLLVRQLAVRVPEPGFVPARA